MIPEKALASFEEYASSLHLGYTPSIEMEAFIGIAHTFQASSVEDTIHAFQLLRFLFRPMTMANIPSLSGRIQALEDAAMDNVMANAVASIKVGAVAGEQHQERSAPREKIQAFEDASVDSELADGVASIMVDAVASEQLQKSSAPRKRRAKQQLSQLPEKTARPCDPEVHQMDEDD